jgi:hypothetical protein
MSELLKDLRPSVEIFKKDTGGYLVVHPEKTRSGMTTRVKLFEGLDDMVPYLQRVLEPTQAVKEMTAKALAQLAKAGWRRSGSGQLVRITKEKAKRKVKRKAKR